MFNIFINWFPANWIANKIDILNGTKYVLWYSTTLLLHPPLITGIRTPINCCRPVYYFTTKPICGSAKELLFNPNCHFLLDKRNVSILPTGLFCQGIPFCHPSEFHIAIPLT